MLFWGTQLFAQQKDTLNYEDFQIVFDLDVFEVTASRFTVEDFVALVQEDESFYKAFQNIRFLSYESSNVMDLFDKKERKKASFDNQIKQTSDGKCRQMQVLEEQVEGDFYKRNKKYRYYTAKMLDRLFFTHGTRCGDPYVKLEEVKPQSKMEQYIRELKTLIFSPGEEVDVPMLGKKMAIFSPKMSRFYNFEILSRTYQNEIDCYVFSVSLKPEFIKKEGKTVLKNLQTYFSKEDFQVVARDYRLAYNTAIYDFDVTMKIELGKFGQQYVPTLIQYDGNWDIPARKPEIAKFEIEFWNYH